MSSGQFRSHPVPTGTNASTPPPTSSSSSSSGGALQYHQDPYQASSSSSSFSANAALQELIPSQNAPLDEQVHVLRGAVVVTLEEVERLKNSMMVENGKLQREMRDVARLAQQSSGSSSAWGGGTKTTESLLSTSSGGGGGGNAASGGAGAGEDVNSRLEYLEHALRGVQQHQSLHAPVAMENAISQCSIFLRKADQEVQRVVTQMAEKMNGWQRIMDNFVANGGGGVTPALMNNNNNNNNSSSSSLGAAGTSTTTALNQLEVMNDVKRMVQARIMELSSYIDQELASHRGSIITLEDKMGAVVDTVSQMEAESNAFRAAVSRPHVRNSIALSASSSSQAPLAAAAVSNNSNNTSAAGGNNKMTSPAIDDLSSPPKQQQQQQQQGDQQQQQPQQQPGTPGMNQSGVVSATSGRSFSNNNNTPGGVSGAALRSVRSPITLGATGGGVATANGNATAEAMQSLLREFTSVESGVIRDEVLKLLDGESSLTRRRLEERNRGEQVSMLRQDVVRTVTSLETIQEDHTRLERSHQDIHRAFQRLEQQFTLLQHKTDGDVRTELSRMEQLQKSFFTRQEQLIAAERQTMVTNVTEEVSRLQQKHVEEMRLAERRRMDDLQAAQKQIRDDFVAFAEKQRTDLDSSIQHVKDDFTTLSTQSADNVARSLANATDATRRSFMNTTDEMRKSYNKISDDMRRLQSGVEDQTKRNQEQSAFLQQRLQQVIDEQVVRVDRMGDDLALRLNTAVEEEVRRMTQSSETSLQRAFSTVDERQSRDTKAMREEIASIRQALHAMSAPSSTLQSMDSRVDALRNDTQEMFEAVAALKRNEPRVVNDTRREVNSALETARSEITRNVSVQLQQFDATLSELHRESMARSQELTALQMRLDQAVQTGSVSSSANNNRGISANSVSGVVNTPLQQHQRSGSASLLLQQQQQQNQQPSSATAAGGGGGTSTVTGVRTPTNSTSQKRDALQGAFDM